VSNCRRGRPGGAGRDLNTGLDQPTPHHSKTGSVQLADLGQRHLLVYVALQRQITDGVTAGALK